MMSIPVLFLKAHIPGYTRKDGTVVLPHETKAPSAHKAATPAKKASTAQWPGWDSKKPLDLFGDEDMPPASWPPKAAPVAGAQFGGKTASAEKKKWTNSLHSGGQKKEPVYLNAITHPESNDAGKPVQINEPSVPSMEHTWFDADATAVFVPGGDVPDSLNGVAFAPWADAPTSIDLWQDVAGQIRLDEPDLELHGKEAAAGVVIEEPDGRIWLINPTNGFGGYTTSFPKGHADDGLALQASAIKEAFEESGLQVEITGMIGDVVRSTTVARYYWARRVGGTPAAMGWESQAVQLVPAGGVHSAVNKDVDRLVAALAGLST